MTPGHQSWAGLIAGGWRDANFRPFREGVEMATLVDGEPKLALLRYAPGAAVPRHRHLGLETIVVLDGVQHDDNGCYGTGALLVNAPGSEHSVWSPEGCVVLIQWTRPVAFVDD